MLGQVMSGEAPDLSPSSAHVTLSSLVEELRGQAREEAPLHLCSPQPLLPLHPLPSQSHPLHPLPLPPEGGGASALGSYEDVLATTVINKVGRAVFPMCDPVSGERLKAADFAILQLYHFCTITSH